MGASREVGAHYAVAQAVLPDQPPPAVLAEVKVLEDLHQTGAELGQLSSCASARMQCLCS